MTRRIIRIAKLCFTYGGGVQSIKSVLSCSKLEAREPVDLLKREEDYK